MELLRRVRGAHARSLAVAATDGAAAGDFSYGALAAAAEALARLIPSPRRPDGSGHGPRVAIFAAPGPEFVAASWACWAAGAIAVRPPPAARAPSLPY
jgi:acyl-CoA synthetase (AMP-forming)/AMP-acid ligase II